MCSVYENRHFMSDFWIHEPEPGLEEPGPGLEETRTTSDPLKSTVVEESWLVSGFQLLYTFKLFGFISVNK